MKTMLRGIQHGEKHYPALMFICPGCLVAGHGSGLHILPVNTDQTSPSWHWDGDLEKPSLSPSILTKGHDGLVCHSFLKQGIFVFLGDSTHSLSGEAVDIPDLPEWVTNEADSQGSENQSDE